MSDISYATDSTLEFQWNGCFKAKVGSKLASHTKPLSIKHN